MKRIFALVAVLAICAALLCACVNPPKPQQLSNLSLPALAENEMAVIIKHDSNNYTAVAVRLGENGVRGTVTGGTETFTAEDVLAYLAEKNVIHLVWRDGSYGKEILELGSLVPNADNREFISVFTSVEEDFATWAGALTYKADEIDLVTSGKGVSGMTVKPGCVIYFEIETY